MYYRLRFDDVDVVVGEFTSAGVLATTTPKLVFEAAGATMRFEIARNNTISIAIENMAESPKTAAVYLGGGGMCGRSGAFEDFGWFAAGPDVVVLEANGRHDSIYAVPGRLNDREFHADCITPRSSAGVRIVVGQRTFNLTFHYRLSPPQPELSPTLFERIYTDGSTEALRHTTTISHATDALVQRQTHDQLEALEARMSALEARLEARRRAGTPARLHRGA